MMTLMQALFIWVVLVGLFRPVQSLAATKQVVTANNDFAMDLYGQVRSKSLEKNIFFSPFSVSSALAMVYAGAKGNTKKEMGNVLKFNTVSTRNVHAGFRSLFEAFNDPTNNYTLNIANAFFGRKGYTFLQTYLNIVTKFYSALLKNLDFIGKTEASRKFINDWVASNTNQKIKNLLSAGSIKTSTVAVLVNTIYFKGVWKIPFKVKHTITSTFHLTTGKSMTTKMMNFAGKSLNYADVSSLNCKVLELPYVGDEVSMYILLPNSINGLAALESNLTSTKLDNAISSMYSAKVDVSIPKFEMTLTIQLNDMLMAMGMVDLFGKADLSGVDGTRNLFVSKVVHKAYINVNEEGTEAAAATAVVLNECTAIEPRRVFKADHPFLFFIREKVTNSILFSGRVVKPPKAGAGTGSTTQPSWCEGLPKWVCDLLLWFCDSRRKRDNQ